MVRKVLSFVVVALGITALLLPWAIQKAGAQEASLQLHRRLEHPSVLIGEEVAVTFELIYTGDGELSYTLIEEVPPEIEPVDTGAGSYNRLAGFIVWTGALHGGQPHEVRYTLRLTEEAASRVPLYAYVSASNGQTSESAAELKRVELPLQIGFERTYIAPGERTTFQLRVENPLERPLHLLLRVEGPEDLGLAELPANLQLAPGAVYDASFPTREMAEGTYLVRLRPLVGRHPVGPEGRATLTVSTVRDERFEASVFDPWQDERTPGFSERVHSVSLPSRYLTPGEQLLLFVRQPDGAHYVSGTGQVSASSTEAVEPYLSEGHLIFPVPSETEFKVRYVLAYEDAGLITPGEREDEEIGLLSLGRQARVLRGTSELLHILDAAELWEPLSGEGVEIVSPRHGQIFSDRQHVDVEIEAPEGARIRLYINGELVAQDRLGQQGSDPNTGRYGENTSPFRFRQVKPDYRRGRPS